ncbi:class I SAM-dependent DNA methyltransferase [Paraglaciecola mesophila]|uniref:site-specific DNA-methyltransferase (adenine-specific) n=1 Tax=Paraglaciecola mesophila TaxID=197222 RepID=A0ABU9SPZ9_9ALTE
MSQKVSSQTPNNLAAFCWSIADLLRGDFKQSQYGRIILPFTLLRRLEGMLESTKEKVLTELDRIKALNLPGEVQEVLLLRATGGLSFFNTSKMDLSKLGEPDIKANLQSYIQCFSKDVREIFEYFNFAEFIGQLNDAKLLYKVVLCVRQADLSPKAISNHDMGLGFEELIRRFAEGSNETAGEHFTPRDVVNLTTSLVFMGDDELLSQDEIIRTVYDPTAGTGGFLSVASEYISQVNPREVIQSYGQEINPEAYAICKSHMLIRGQDFNNIKLGNTLSNDKFREDKFDYMFSNAPFGHSWIKERATIERENKEQGAEGRFAVGLPRINDGSLLFLMHLVRKLKNESEGGGRIGIILNGSPLFAGGAGSGESEIRRYILENDLLETIVALPTHMFYNTAIPTFLLILSNRKIPKRQGKVQLINSKKTFSKMRKAIGSKRNIINNDHLTSLVDICFKFEVNNESQQHDGLSKPAGSIISKIIDNKDFAYRKISVEQPLRLSAQMNDYRINRLGFTQQLDNEIMQSAYNAFQVWDKGGYVNFEDIKENAKNFIKNGFPGLSTREINKVLDNKAWQFHEELVEKAYLIQEAFKKRDGGKFKQTNNFNKFDEYLQEVAKKEDINLTQKEYKLLIKAVSWKNPEAEPVINKVIKQESPTFGTFLYKKQVVEFKPDSELRETEKIPFGEDVYKFFKCEIAPHYEYAWINKSQVDTKDGELGVVGYEISLEMFSDCNVETIFNSVVGGGIELRRLGLKLLGQEESWDVTVNRASGKALLREAYEGGGDNNYTSYLSVPVDINKDYLVYELNKQLEKQNTIANDASRFISIDKLNRIKLNLPALSMQEDFVEDRKFLIRMISDFTELFTRYGLEPESHNRIKLEKFKDSIDETQFIINKAPYFLSELLNRSTNLEGKDRFEVLLKFLECTSIYFCSILYSQYDGKQPPSPLTSIRKEYATFSRWNSLLKELVTNKNSISSIAKQLLPSLEKANAMRNTSVGHGAIPTKKQIAEDLQSIELTVSSVNEILLEAFDNYELIYPLKNTWDGFFYTYEVITYSGLCGYPYSNNEIKVREPFLDGGLYLISKDRETVYPIQNFMTLSDISKDSQIDGFYFYSKNDRNSGQNEFICHQQVPIQTKLINEKL